MNFRKQDPSNFHFVKHFWRPYFGFRPEDTMSSKMICSIKSGRDPFKTVAWHPSKPVIAIARGSMFVLCCCLIYD